MTTTVQSLSVIPQAKSTSAPKSTGSGETQNVFASNTNPQNSVSFTTQASTNSSPEQSQETEAAIKAWQTNSSTYEKVKNLHDAMNPSCGRGVDVAAINDILNNSTPEQLAAIERDYGQTYGKSEHPDQFRRDLRSKLAGQDDPNLLGNGNLHYSEQIDTLNRKVATLSPTNAELAIDEAVQSQNLGEGGNGMNPDKETVEYVINHSSPSNIKELDKCFRADKGCSLARYLQRGGIGDPTHNFVDRMNPFWRMTAERKPGGDPVFGTIQNAYYSDIPPEYCPKDEDAWYK